MTQIDCESVASAESNPKLTTIPATPARSKGTPVANGSRRPLRVLHVLNRLDAGGTEYAALRVINGLDSKEFEHAICVTRGVSPEWTHSEAKVQEIFSVGDQSRDRQLLVLKLCKVMKTYRPDILHSRNWGAIEAVLSAKLSGIPVVIHSEHGYELDQLSGLPLRQRMFRRFAYALADAIFAVSKELRDYHARQVWQNPEKLRVIYNGVDIVRFAPRPTVRAEMRRAWGIPEGRLIVGSVGRMVPIKDYQTLLTSAERLARRGFDVHVVLAGGGSELARLQERARNSELLEVRTTFLGPTPDVAAVLPAFDVFVLPSLAEGMSNTLLEAMSTGLPLIASDVGGNPELISDGVTGLLFTAGSPTDLKCKLETLLRDPSLRERLGAEARRKTHSEFNLSRMISDYRNLYLDCALKQGATQRATREPLCAE